ncbi:MAG TPA: carboxylesterase family protein [Terriglobales bacterium]|jgi:para-nitrobenzyl esterase
MYSTSAVRLFRWFCASLLAGVLILGILGEIAASAYAAETEPVVKTMAGELQGMLAASGRAEFLGIRYAEPPLGELRWRPPVPVKAWQGVRDVQHFGAPCAQMAAGEWNRRDAENSQEDCLFLNVITPQWPIKGKLPVMFWIHGGGNTGGTASSALYKDGTLVDHGVILVTVNYRLGVFGFLAHPELTKESPHHASGDYGLMDQIAALHWVHDNIANFGGDPGNITVFGQSAGAHDASLLMVSPLAKNLFEKVIGESGTSFGFSTATLAETEQSGQKLAEMLGAPAGQDPIKYMRGLSVAEIFRVLESHEKDPSPGFAFDVDGWVIPTAPAKVFAAGQEAKVAMIMGNNSREFDFPLPTEALRHRIREVYGDLAPKVLEVYGLSDGGQGVTDPLYGTVANQYSADGLFRCAAVAQSAFHQAAHNPTYEYQFEHADPGHESEGAVHSAELPYVFGFYPSTGNIGGVFGDADHKLAEIIESYWTNFAKTGNPNGNGLSHWPEFGGNGAYIRFTQDVRVGAAQGLRKRQCDLYRENLERTLKP